MPTFEEIRALSKAKTPEALTALAKLMTSRDAFVRRAALEAIGNHPDSTDMTKTVIRSLSDPSAYVQRMACELVEQWKLVEAREDILPMLALPDFASRISAIKALSVIGEPGDFDRLLAICLKDPNDSVRKAAVTALNSRLDARNWRAFFDVFSADTQPRHRCWAIQAAARFGAANVEDKLAAALHDTDGHVRHAASQAISALKNRR